MRSVKSNIVINFGFAVLRAILIFGIIAYATNILNPILLGLFLLVRRLSATAANVVQLGTSQTIKRFIAFHSGSLHKKYSYFLYGTIIGLISSFFFIAIFSLLPNYTFSLLFPQLNGSLALSFWFAVLTVSYVFHFIANSTLLSEQRFITSNILETTNSCLIPILALFLNSESPDLLQIIITISCFVVASSGTTLIILGFHYRLQTGTSRTLNVLNDFVIFGLPRGGSTFLDGMILTLVPWLIREKPEEAGYLLIAFTVLRVFQSIIMPVSQVLSIHITKNLGQNKTHSIEETVKLLFYSVAVISPLATFVLYFASDFLLNIWLAKEDVIQGVKPYLLILAFGFFPYNVFYSFRNIIDMVWVKPYNILVFSSALFSQWLIFELCLLGQIPINPAFAVTSSFFILGGLPLFLFFRKGYLKGNGFILLSLVLLLTIWLPLFFPLL